MASRDRRPSALESNPLAIERVAGIEIALKDWAGKKVEFSFNSAGTDLFSIHELAHSYARRAVDLVASIRLLVQDQRIVPATILGRALIETVAMGCFFLHEIKRLVAAGHRQRVNDRVKRFYAGVKGGSTEPIHVMDAMRHLEKVDGEYVAYLDGKYGLLAIAAAMAPGSEKRAPESMRDALSALKNYDRLSEVAHPNGTGTQFLYPNAGEPSPQADDLRERFRHASLTAIWQGHHLVKALEELDAITESYRRAFLPDKPTT